MPSKEQLQQTLHHQNPRRIVFDMGSFPAKIDVILLWYPYRVYSWTTGFYRKIHEGNQRKITGRD
jgi:cobalamin biosynthesis protein CobD/CbiB